MKQKVFISLLAAVFCASAGTLKAQDCASGYCPDSITVHHVANDVSPVTVTITYPVVETTLGSGGTDNYCWLTQNLGATAQPSSPTDGSVEPRGWFWQFNRKQGYAYDGSRTPSTTWTASISENMDWQTGNDPCTLLLGANWRLPTKTEWDNALAEGGWDGYNSSFDSVLKMHLMGDLGYTSGAFQLSGSSGFYWSSTQNATDNARAWYYNTASQLATMNHNYKSYAIAVRCVYAL